MTLRKDSAHSHAVPVRFKQQGRTALPAAEVLHMPVLSLRLRECLLEDGLIARSTPCFELIGKVPLTHRLTLVDEPVQACTAACARCRTSQRCGGGRCNRVELAHNYTKWKIHDVTYNYI